MKKNVYFYSDGTKIVGHLYDSQKTPSAAIVVVTPWGGVKEQTAGIYAKKLADNGFITLAFDHSSYGESEGVPRCNEDPYKKVEDIKNAVSFIKNNTNVRKIFALGICSGAAYVAQAASILQDDLCGIASVSGYYHDLFRRLYLVDAVGKDGVKTLMKQAREAKEKYLYTGEAIYIPHIPEIDENSLEIVKDFYSYYRTERGLVPNYVCRTLLSSLELLGGFSAISSLQNYAPKPCLFIVGANAKSSYESYDAYNAIDGKKEIFVIEKANHTDLYDQDKYVNQSVSKITDFFTT